MPSSKNSDNIEKGQLIFKPNKLAGFYMVRGFAEGMSEQTIVTFGFC